MYGFSYMQKKICKVYTEIIYKRNGKKIIAKSRFIRLAKKVTYKNQNVILHVKLPIMKE